MNKIICMLMSLFLMGNIAFAQNADTKAKQPDAKKEAKAKHDKKEGEKKGGEAKKGDKPTKMKKDGTPDMRYKENKDAARKAEGPKKKDGTPDMRHKANKEAAAKKGADKK